MTTTEHRLRVALREDADIRPATDADWAEFTSRLTRRAAARRASRWRVPLIAAAAVVVIAIATSAVVTHGFAGTDEATSPPTRDTSCADERADTQPVTIPVTDSGADGVGAAVTMFFASGTPPNARLCVSESRTAAEAVTTSRLSDGTPLGYLTLIPAAAANDGPMLWGAVGPGVDMVGLSALGNPIGRSGSGGSALSISDRADWMFASITKPRWRISDDPATIWKALGSGWHGFAVQLPRDTKTVLAIAASSAKGAVQARPFDAVTGTFSDQPSPQVTAGSPVAHSGPDTAANGTDPDPATTGPHG